MAYSFSFLPDFCLQLQLVSLNVLLALTILFFCLFMGVFDLVFTGDKGRINARVFNSRCGVSEGVIVSTF